MVNQLVSSLKDGHFYFHLKKYLIPQDFTTFLTICFFNERKKTSMILISSKSNSIVKETVLYMFLLCDYSNIIALQWTKYEIYCRFMSKFI